MAESPARVSALNQFGGLVTDVDPHDLPPGGLLEQTNMEVITPGMLKVRRGMVRTGFVNGTTGTTHTCLSMTEFRRPDADFLVYCDSAGNIRAGRNLAISATATAKAGPVIRSGLNMFSLPSYMKVPDGHLIAVNGIDRGMFWNGSTPTSSWLLGITAPTTPPSVVSNGGLPPPVNYQCYYRYGDDLGNFSNLSDVTAVSHQPNGGGTLTWGFSISPEVRVTKRELWRTLAGETDVIYKVHVVADNTTTTYVDAATDNQLLAAAILDNTRVMSIKLSNGRPNANRFTPPPNFKRVAIWFQDRAFYLADVIYDQGTVSTVNNTPTVTGIGTDWTSTMQGRYVYIPGASKGYQIQSATATSITLTENFVDGTLSSSTYAIRPSHSERNRIYYSEQNEPESVPSVNERRIQHDQNADDELVGAYVHRGFLWLIKENHLYRLTYVSQPQIDLTIRLAVNRGAFNHRCCDSAEELMFLMDVNGMYQFDGETAVPIGDALHNYWRDNLIDFSKSKWFYVEADEDNHVVRFHVTLHGNTKPKHAFVFNYRQQMWWLDEYQNEMPHSCQYRLQGRSRRLLGSWKNVVYLADEGTVDGTSAIGVQAGTASTANASNQLVDATASFPIDCVGASLVIVRGTGKGQKRLITGVATTALTVDTNWTTAIARDSQYQIGGIPWSMTTQKFRYIRSYESDAKREARLTFDPTDQRTTLDVRLIRDHNPLPENNVFDHDGDGRGVTWKANQPDKVVELTRNQSLLSQASGHKAVEFDDSMEDRSEADRWLSVQVRGVQGASPVKIYGMELFGVEPG